ncbi:MULTISPECIES: sigma-54 dependent transcriptional regulator [unclassified Nostoc]|uniref:sigma-54-dependent transcriptional regulator n=1 Tax=unclassified Nostoc TaxID=2593658 RepID=UPI002AD55296|nr:sigma-54 dependent transcriptional regulator [Nostoc sp. DedQUE03]MDZ7971486.1 sigma-54 dependent transcriptional regulator [Nostoc sp. DedQUE03]MDZ8046480.1 sigma-54 dependent transcriptional regulator [Nostoc sp. DedQUE02]
MAKILIIDDEKALRQAMAQILKDEGYDVIEAEDGEQGLKMIQQDATSRPDLVFLDLKMPKTQGSAVLKALGSKTLFEVPVIVMTAYGTSRTAIEAMQLGAYDYLTKPFDLEDLVNLAQKALAHSQASAEQIGEANIQNLGQPEELLGRSPKMAEVFKLIGRLAQGNTTVLIVGESGTGKELVASTLHNASPRSRGPLVKVNCAALPEHLLEAELFGHEKGAFTGANHLRIGRFEQANGGTIFLDEVGELSQIIQGKLLRVLQDKSFERLGSNQTKTVDVRILAATNRNLEQLVRLNQFREDLYYRFNVVRIELPLLRDRPEDLEQLTQHFLSSIALRNGTRNLAITSTALEKLRDYPWPGNVRELQNTLERAAVFSGGRTILSEHLIFNQEYQMNLNLEQAIAQLEINFIRRALALYPQEPHKPLGISVESFEQKKKQWNL